VHGARAVHVVAQGDFVEGEGEDGDKEEHCKAEPQSTRGRQEGCMPRRCLYAYGAIEGSMRYARNTPFQRLIKEITSMVIVCDLHRVNVLVVLQSGYQICPTNSSAYETLEYPTALAKKQQVPSPRNFKGDRYMKSLVISKCFWLPVVRRNALEGKRDGHVA
jgi:hypothetical protein